MGCGVGGSINPKSSPWVKAFTSVFLLPFGLAGLAVIAGALWIAFSGGPKGEFPLVARVIAGVVGTAFGTVFALVGFGGIYGLWFGKAPDDAPVSVRAAAGAQRWLFVLMALVFGGAGIGIAIFMTPEVIRAFQCQNWTAVPCVIEDSRVHTSSDSDGTTYKAEVRYRYTVNGEAHHSSRLRFLPIASGGRESHAREANRYPVGSTQQCFVNPANPQEAVLDPSIGPRLFFALFPLPFIGVGAFLLWNSTRRHTDSGPVSRRSRAASGTASVGAEIPGPDATPTARLRPAHTPRTKAIGATIAAVLVNGIIWPILVTQWTGGRDWILIIFLSVFALVGLGVACGAVYLWLAVKNPVPALELTPSCPAPGETCRLAWGWDRPAHRLSSLTLELIGREEATYRRGTDTVTDKHTFHSSLLATSERGAAIESGTVTFQIPAGSMHSFAASNNKIVWLIELRAPIPRWPDVKEEFVIDVRPAPVTR
jgi:hypothetical protein